MTFDTSSTGPLYRYPGTKPFEANESELFRGRDEDISNLYELISLQNLIVLFGRSGLGKSSLLNAGLITRFNIDRSMIVLFVRFGAYYEKNIITPLEKLRHSISTGQATTNFIFDKLIPIEEITMHRLWYFFKSFQIANPDKQKFVLIFDQFEELFTYPETEINLFKKELSELLYVSVPQQLRNILKDKLLLDPNYLTKDEKDQLFTPLNIKILFSIRADKLSLLNNLNDYFPSILKLCYELKPLSRAQAQQAIEDPAKLADKNYISATFTFTKEALDLILDSLTNSKNSSGKDNTGQKQEIETFQLQIVCKYAENLVIEKGLTQISASDLGDIKSIFENHYRNIISKLAKNNQLPARRLIEEKLIIDGMRVSMPIPFILRDPGMTKELLDELIVTHILRPEQNNTVEISHDTLIEPILKYYDERKKQEKIDAELKEKEDQIKRIREEQEDQLKEQARQQELSTQRLKAKRNRVVLIISCIALFFTICLAYYAVKQKNIAVEKSLMAHEKTLTADRQKEAFRLISIAQDTEQIDPTIALKYAKRAFEKEPDSLIVRIKERIEKDNIFYDNLVSVAKDNFISISKDGSVIITGDSDGKDSLRDMNGKLKAVFKQNGQLRAFDITHDGKTLLLGSKTGSLALYNLDGSIKNLPAEPKAITTALFSPDEHSILIRSETGEAWLLDPDGNKIRQFTSGFVICALFSEDGSMIATGSTDGLTTVWNINGTIKKQFSNIWVGNIMSLAFSRDNNSLITGSWSGITNKWMLNTSSKDPDATITNNCAVSCLSFATGYNRLIYMGTYDGVIKIWGPDIDEKNYNLISEFKGHRGIIKNIVSSADGQKCFTSANDGFAKVWNY